jgi:hypothetical protein
MRSTLPSRSMMSLRSWSKSRAASKGFVSG